MSQACDFEANGCGALAQASGDAWFVRNLGFRGKVRARGRFRPQPSARARSGVPAKSSTRRPAQSPRRIRMTPCSSSSPAIPADEEALYPANEELSSSSCCRAGEVGGAFGAFGPRGAPNPDVTSMQRQRVPPLPLLGSKRRKTVLWAPPVQLNGPPRILLPADATSLNAKASGGNESRKLRHL